MPGRIIPATSAHIAYIAANMRAADRAEVWAASGLSPAEGLAVSVRGACEVWAGLADDVPACVFGLGIASLAGGTARPWLLGTDAIERHRTAFLRRNRAVVRRWLADWPLLENVVDARHVHSIRWLRWLGFLIDAAAPCGPFGLPFHRFWMQQ